MPRTCHDDPRKRPDPALFWCVNARRSRLRALDGFAVALLRLGRDHAFTAPWRCHRLLARHTVAPGEQRRRRTLGVRVTGHVCQRVQSVNQWRRGRLRGVCLSARCVCACGQSICRRRTASNLVRTTRLSFVAPRHTAAASHHPCSDRAFWTVELSVKALSTCFTAASRRQLSLDLLSSQWTPRFRRAEAT